VNPFTVLTREYARQHDNFVDTRAPMLNGRPRRFVERHRDELAVAAVALIISLPYIARLGFYNDDWAFLAAFENATHKDLWSLIRSQWGPNEFMRPLTVAYQSALYWMFGRAPVGYHAVNAAVFAISCALFNRTLNELGFCRRRSLAVALIWAALPHASAMRVWYAAFRVVLSLATAFAAILFELRAVRRRQMRWRVLSIVCICASALLYEVALPWFLMLPLLSARRARLDHRALDRAERVALFAYPAAVVLLIAVKILTTTRLEVHTAGAFGSWFFDNARNMLALQRNPDAWGFNIWQALDISFIQLGLALPRHAIESAKTLAGTIDALVVIASSLATFLWLWRIPPEPLSRKGGAACVGVGLFLFMAGWIVFLGSASLQLTATGIGNRTAAAASIGVALVWWGAFEFLVVSVSKNRACFVSAALCALLSGASTLVFFNVAEHWARAWEKEQDVLARIHNRFPNGFSGRTLLLDGVCQYDGPATIFEAAWDLEWALQARYRDSRIRADVVTEDLEVRTADLRTALYGEERLHPYGSVVAYRPDVDVARMLDSAADAEEFFRRWDDDKSGGCLPGRIGHGADVFDSPEPVIHVKGFYGPEHDPGGHEWLWMSVTGVATLKNEGRTMVLTIKGTVPPQLAGAASVRVKLNGAVLGTIEGTDIDVRYVVPSSTQGDGVRSLLRISTDQSFVPNAVDPLSQDRRRLGLIIARLVWTAQ